MNVLGELEQPQIHSFYDVQSLSPWTADKAAKTRWDFCLNFLYGSTPNRIIELTSIERTKVFLPYTNKNPRSDLVALSNLC